MLAIRLFCIFSKILAGGVLPLCRNTVDVFCSFSRLGQVTNRAAEKKEELLHQISIFYVFTYINRYIIEEKSYVEVSVYIS